MEVLRTAHAPSWQAQAHALRASLPPHALIVLLISTWPLILPASQCTRTHRVQVFAGAAVLRGRVGARAHHGAPDFDRR